GLQKPSNCKISRGILCKIMYITEKEVREMLQTAVRAPSGDNLQPWRFVLKGKILQIFDVKSNDTVYNYKLRGTYVSHGALIENIVITASHFGYRAYVTLFPETNREHMADILLEKGEVVPDPLYDSIETRTTNRKMYKGTPLTPEQR